MFAGETLVSQRLPELKRINSLSGKGSDGFHRCLLIWKNHLLITNCKKY
jgi:hypothetical protein